MLRILSRVARSTLISFLSSQKPKFKFISRKTIITGEPIEATLGEDQMMRLALPAGTEDSSEIVVLARRSEDRDEGEGEIEIKAVDEDGGKLSSWGMYVSTEDDDWSKKSEILWSHEIGSAKQVFIIVKNTKPESGKAPQLDVKVKRQGT